MNAEELFYIFVFAYLTFISVLMAKMTTDVETITKRLE